MKLFPNPYFKLLRMENERKLLENALEPSPSCCWLLDLQEVDWQDLGTFLRQLCGVESSEDLLIERGG